MTLVEFLASTGPRRSLDGPLKHVVWGVSVTVAAGILWTTVGTYVDLFAVTIAFLSVMLALVFLTIAATESSDTARPNLLDVVMALAGIAAGIYFFIDSERIITRITLLDELTTWDVVFSSILLVLTIEATRRTVGMGLTVIVLLFIAYNLYGDALPGKLGHGKIDYLHFLDIMMFTTDGVFGVPIRVAATYAFLFVMFGTFLSKAGGADFFFSLSAGIAGRSPGGPAKIAVISSALYGTLSGSPTSDVVTTGSVTIPIMKRLGYRPALAGAVEVAASTGGSILPPVMGSAAFIMAEFTGIDYRDIVIAAIVPALLFYLSVFLQVHLRSLSMGLRGLDADQVPRIRTVVRDGWIFVVPLAALTVALLLGYSPTYVAVFGAASVVAVTLPRKRTRLGVKAMLDCLAETTMRTIPVVGACAAAGLVIGGLSMTGLAAKFADIVFLFAGDGTFMALLISALLAILLGMGMPTPSAYILAAVLVGPTLAKLGFSAMQGNLFLLYFAVLSAMTPPVAVAAFAAAAIAEANPLEIGAMAVRMAIAAFIVPFAFIYGDGLLLEGGLMRILVDCVTAAGGVALVAVAAEGYFRDRLDTPVRLMLAGAGLALIAASLYSILVAAVLLGLALVASATLRVQLAGLLQRRAIGAGGRRPPPGGA